MRSFYANVFCPNPWLPSGTPICYLYLSVLVVSGISVLVGVTSDEDAPPLVCGLEAKPNVPFSVTQRTGVSLWVK